MEVTKRNFKDVLATLPEVFKQADFIAFDTEFTGLRVEGAGHLNFFDTLEDIYQKDKVRAETFMAIQYGIVAFKYQADTNIYTHNAYNFYIFPGSSYPDINFTCQPGSIDFLVRHGFDFNKLFGEGIPYLTESDGERLLEKMSEKHDRIRETDNSVREEMRVPDEHKTLIDGVCQKLQEFLKQKQDTSISLGKHNRYVRRLIYSSVQERFNNKIHLETNRDENMIASIGVSVEESKRRMEERFEREREGVLDNVGFTQVVKAIMDSGKPLIGHNLLLDLLFTIRQFLQPLPASYEELKTLSHFLFPKLLDTKHMASGAELRGPADSTLSGLVEYWAGREQPKIESGTADCGYSITDNKLHEAAYDAFLTGICFIGMANHLGQINKTNIHKSLTVSPFITPFYNKLYTPRLHDIPYMNLGGVDHTPSHENVFHMTFPKEWKRDDIYKVFKTYGFINISWLNDTTAYIGVKKDQVQKIKKNLMKLNSDYKLRTWDEFKSAEAEKLDPEDEFPQAMDLGTSNGEKRRSQSEDLGEVITRPKKLCSFETPPFD